MACSHSTHRFSLFLGAAFALLCADSALAQRRINPVVLTPVASYALPREAMLVDGVLAAPLAPFFDMNDWLPFLGMLGLLPIERDTASQKAMLILPAAWQALYERRLLKEPILRAIPIARRR